MTRGHCTVAVTEEVTKVAGIASVEVDLDTA
jgi:copper chaperone CopZ